MVRRSERCLGSRLKNIKSNKDDPILIDDYTEQKLRNEEPMEYQPLKTIYPEEDLRRPTCTQIVVYND
uniref:Uncharacterized protein n=1 Tax=Cucumis melo TaxID=3656 RepID=A0A9I9EH64_CUCME